MLTFLKSLFAGAEAPLLKTPASYPGTMAEMVEYLVLLQAPGTAPGSNRKDNLVRLATTLGNDPYCLGYLTGMLECLCHQWEVPAPEQRLVMGSATTLLFRDLLDKCCDPRRATVIEDAAFNGLLAFGSDPAFQRGKFDGCSELTRYSATKEQQDMPAKLHDRLRQLATSACN